MAILPSNNYKITDPVSKEEEPVIVKRNIIYNKEIRGKDGKPGANGKDGTTIDIDNCKYFEFHYTKNITNSFIFNLDSEYHIKMIPAGLYKIYVFTTSRYDNAMPCISYTKIGWFKLNISTNILTLLIDNEQIIPNEFIVNEKFRNIPNFIVKCYIEAYKE